MIFFIIFPPNFLPAFPFLKPDGRSFYFLHRYTRYIQTIETHICCFLHKRNWNMWHPKHSDQNLPPQLLKACKKPSLGISSKRNWEGISLHTLSLGKFPNFSVSDSPLSTETQAPLTPQRYFVGHQFHVENVTR